MKISNSPTENNIKRRRVTVYSNGSMMTKTKRFI